MIEYGQEHVTSRGVMIPSLVPDLESDFQILVILDTDSDPVKK